MMTLSVFASTCSRGSAESDLLGEAADTFPNLLLEHARVRPDRRKKDYGIWQCWSWAEVVAEVEAVARPAGPGPIDNPFGPNFQFQPQLRILSENAVCCSCSESAARFPLLIE